MIKVYVNKPHKNKHEYTFKCSIQFIYNSIFPIKRFAKYSLLNRGYDNRNECIFGFKAKNFDIPHSQVWDSIYPLFYLTRRGGPLYGKDDNHAVIEFDFPVLKEAKDFFIKRASKFGIYLDVKADFYSKEFELETKENALSFSGGKDSGLLYGLLRELGKTPELFSTTNVSARNYENLPIKKSVALGEDLASRLIPAFISNFKNIYYGAALDELVYREPWQQYYDQGSQEAAIEFSNFLKSIGIEKSFRSPAGVLPSNLIQSILYKRYPDLYRKQFSVKKGKKTKKNLHISLCKIYHGIDYSNQSSEKLFKTLLSDFVEKQLKYPNLFGFRDHREIFHKEMRSIIYRMREHPLFSEVKDDIPDSWNADWIDQIHLYLKPDIDEDILTIFKEYAPIADNNVWQPDHANAQC